MTRLIAGLVVATLLTATTVALTATARASGTFEDDNGSVHEGDIESLASQGITRGCNPPLNDRFCPEDAVTRGQMAAFLHRALDGQLAPGEPVEFIDDNGSVFEPDIEWLGATGITRGCNPPTNNRFCPDEPVTREQMAAFLHRALEGFVAPGEPVEFVDDDESVFEADIEWLGATGITRGCNPPTNDRFCPDDPVTRGQMASFLVRAIDELGGDGTPDPDSSTTTTDSTTTTTTDSSTSTTTTAPWTEAVWVDVEDGSGPEARHESGMVLVGDTIYLIGGRGSRSVEKFDLSSGTGWSQVGDAETTQFHHLQPVIVHGTVYLPGAMTGNCCLAENETPVTHLPKFNPAMGTISDVAPMPAGRPHGAAGAVTDGTWIYIAGGVTGGHGDDNHMSGDPGAAETENVLHFDRYNPATNKWEDLDDLPRGRDHFHMALVGDRIYLIGGRLTETPLPGFWKQPAQVAPVDVYDISEGRWLDQAEGDVPPPLEIERAGMMTAVVGTRIVVIGGEGGVDHDASGDPAHGRVDVLDTETGEWSTLTTIDPPRHGTGAVVCMGDIYVAAGSEERGGDAESTEFSALDTSGDGLGCLGN